MLIGYRLGLSEMYKGKKLPVYYDKELHRLSTKRRVASCFRGHG